MRLTDLTIKNLRFTGKVVKHFDDNLPNFGVRVYPSGVSFIVMLGLERRMKTLGRYPSITLKDARQKALTILNRSTAPSSPKTSVEAISTFLAHCEQRNKPRTVRDYSRLLKSFPGGNLAEIDRSTLLTQLDALRATPAEQSHVTTAFQVFLNWCVNNGIIHTNPIAGLRNQGKIQSRERVLSTDESYSVWNALGDDRASTIIRLCILTGQRKGEVPHISLDGDTAYIPGQYTKNGRDHIFPVGPLTQHYYQPVHFHGWTKAKARLDKASGVSDWTIHDLRRTYATVHAQIGTPIHVIEKLLNHVSGQLAGVAGIYNRYSYMDEMTIAVQRYEDWIQSQVLRHCQT